MDDQFVRKNSKKTNHIKVKEILDKEKIEVKHEDIPVDIEKEDTKTEEDFFKNEDNLDDIKFKTPEETSIKDNKPSADPILSRREYPKIISKKKFDLSILKEKKVFIPLIVVVLILASGGTYLVLNSKKNKSTSPVSTTTKKAPTTVASSLTGLQVQPAINKLPITAVMIENSIDARPQSGLSSAGVVFEAIAEGGVTRFMALYQNNDQTSLGPVRSARPYYVAWAMGFDAAYAHVGGSPDALDDINNWNVKDMNQFYNGDYFQRVSFRDAPHNVYTTLAEMNSLENSKGYNSSSFTPWARKNDSPATNATATKISFSMSGPTYDPVYTYNPQTNSYLRSEDGAPQIDANTKAQLSPKVVIGIVLPLGQGALDASGAYYSDYQYLGTGNAYIFQDGVMTKGTWTKNNNSDQILFTDSNGKQLTLNAGQVWITAIANDSDVTSS